MHSTKRDPGILAVYLKAFATAFIDLNVFEHFSGNWGGCFHCLILGEGKRSWYARQVVIDQDLLQRALLKYVISKKLLPNNWKPATVAVIPTGGSVALCQELF